MAEADDTAIVGGYNLHGLGVVENLELLSFFQRPTHIGSDAGNDGPENINDLDLGSDQDDEDDSDDAENVWEEGIASSSLSAVVEAKLTRSQPSCDPSA